ncbi:MAG: YcgN family cysteine cluster protein [Paracoccaceae bacterium]
MAKKHQNNKLRPKFWEKFGITQLTPAEWEALCDGCGKCCLNKLEDEDTGEIALTRVACRLLDGDSCRCGQYENRRQFVPECIFLTPNNLTDHLHWIPQTCAYRLVSEGRPLFDWHPLVSGDSNSVHAAGISVKGWTIPEFEVDEDDWQDYLIEEPNL